MENVSEDSGQDAGEEPLRILLCPDTKSWSYDHISDNIAKFAGPNKTHKLYMGDAIDKRRISEDATGREHVFFETLFLNRIDLCHVFWREDLFYLLHPRIIDAAALRMGLDYETLVRALNSCAFTTSVYDHLFSSHEEIQDRRTNFALVDGYTVSSRKLHAIYSSEAGIPSPDAVIADGVDTKRFSPAETPRGKSEPFVIGWVGNSVWGKQSQGFDVKGYSRLFQPMLSALKTRGLNVEEKVADPRIRRIPFDEMPDFYRELDLFVCTSAMEGTPNPILEAMACGIPVVSTDVGIVSEAFGNLQKRFMITDPVPEAFADAVAELLADEQLRSALAHENRQRMLEWEWEKRVCEWWPFWRKALKHAANSRNAIRRESYLLSMASIL